MFKITRGHIDRKIDHINNLLGTKGAVKVEYGGYPQQPRVHIESPSGGTRDLSPRLPIGQMNLWLDGFTEGIYTEYKLKHEPKQQPLPFGKK